MRHQAIAGFLGATLLVGACSREIIVAAPDAAQFPDDPFENPLGSELDAGGPVAETDFYIAVNRVLTENGGSEEQSRRAVIHRTELNSASANPIGTRGWRTPGFSSCRARFTPSDFDFDGDIDPVPFTQDIECVIHIEENELQQKGVKLQVNFPELEQCTFGRVTPSWFYRYEPIILNDPLVSTETVGTGPTEFVQFVAGGQPMGYRDILNGSPNSGDNDFQGPTTSGLPLIEEVDDGDFRCSAVYNVAGETVNCCTGSAWIRNRLADDPGNPGNPGAYGPTEELEVDTNTDEACTVVHLKQGADSASFGRNNLFGIPQTKLYSFPSSQPEARKLPFELPPLIFDEVVTFFSQLSANFFIPNVAGPIDWKREFLFPQAFRPPLNTGAFGIIIDSDSGGLATDGQIQLSTEEEAENFSCRPFATPVRIVSRDDLDLPPLDLFVQPQGASCDDGVDDDIIVITEDAEGNVPYDNGLPADGYIYRQNFTSQWGLNPEPFHTFTCTDSAANVRARIKVMVQEWNTVAEFERFIAFTESPPVSPSPGAVNPDERGGDDNQLRDWDDLKNSNVDGVPNGGMLVYPVSQPGFPTGVE